MNVIEKLKFKYIVWILVLFILAGSVYAFLDISYYNNLERRAILSADCFDGEKYVYDNFTLKLGPRGGDTAAWLKDPILDDDGNVLHGNFVGTIYEGHLINTKKRIITDWKLKISVPEDMYLNNAWNGNMEIHQNVGTGQEKVQEIDLSEYSKYDITLDYYLDHTGPMISMKQGDYFIYLPSEMDKETPIYGSDIKRDRISSVLFGFIVYIQDEPLTYEVDFVNGEIFYHLKKDYWDLPVFWCVLVAILALIVCVTAQIVVKIKIKKLMEQKKHDEQIIEQSMSTFINFIDAKDPHTRGHSQRVAIYTKEIAERMGLPEEKCKQFYSIALMHDCGKISIPLTILSKPASLTSEEYETMKKHTIFGKEMLKDFTSIDDIGAGAMYHHERFDGKGYPEGLAGEEIPLVARIICVADAFDAMNSKRCYRDRLTPDVILQELKENKGKQFDPDVVDAILKLIEEGKIKF